MPRVKRYGPQQVSTNALPGARLTAAETDISTGAGLEQARAGAADAMGNFGLGMARIGFHELQKERDRADDAAALEASNRLARVEQQLLYSENGALSRRGKDAFDLPETVNAEFEKQAGEIAKGLKTPRQQAIFARERANRGLNLSGTLHRHVFGERQAWEKSELTEGVKNGVNAAIANALDPRRVAEELGTITDRIQRHGPRAGMSPEAVKAALEGARTDVHVGVVERLLAQNQDQAAKAYFTETKSQISGSALEKIEKALEVGSLRGEAQRKVDAIAAAGGTFKEQLAKAREIENPELRDEVERRIEIRRVQSDREQKETEERQMVDGYNVIDKTGSTDAIPPAIWQSYTGATRSAMLSYAKQKAAGNTPQTNWANYYRLMSAASDMPGSGGRQAFLNVNLMEYRNQLDDTEFKQLAGIQASLRQGQIDAAAKEIDGIRTNMQILDDALAGAKIDKDKNPEQVALLRRRLDERVGALQSLTGKKASNADVQREADELMKSITLQEGGWLNFFPGGAPFRDVTKRVGELQLGDIPAAEKAQLEQALRQTGRAVTDAAMLNLYIATQRRTGKLK